MKKIASLAFIAIALSFSVVAQAQNKVKWKEMDDFHQVMAATFHPAEEGDLQPIRTRSKEMVDKATAWQTSTVPQGYNKDGVAASLKKLVNGAKELDKWVKSNVADKQLVDKLTELHEVFHEIMEKCRKEDHQ